MYRFVTALVTAILFPFMLGSAQAGLLDGATVSGTHWESSTSARGEQFAEIRANTAYLWVMAGANSNGQQESGWSSLQLVFSLDTPTLYSCSMDWVAAVPYPAWQDASVSLTILNQPISTGLSGHLDKTGILQPGSYRTSLFAYASNAAPMPPPGASATFDLELFPEPSTASLFVLGVIGVVRRRRGALSPSVVSQGVRSLARSAGARG